MGQAVFKPSVAVFFFFALEGVFLLKGVVLLDVSVPSAHWVILCCV